MSKLLNTYNNLKRQDSEMLYLFKNGAFYLALQEDASFLANTFNFLFLTVKKNEKPAIY